MKRIKAVIIDDEESARNILSELITRFCEEVEVIGTYSNLELGVTGIEETKPDVVFLDIQMPKYAGYEIIRFFQKIDFEIVFVTAYDNYAIKAFELSAVDYLLKPIEIEKLKISVKRLSEKLAGQRMQSQYKALVENLEESTVKNIVFPYQGKQKILLLKDIVALEAQESYTRIYTQMAEEYTISKNLKQFENMLQDVRDFMRTHKSWIINIQYVDSFSKRDHEVSMYGSVIAKVSKLKQKDFQERLKYQ